MFRIAIVAPFFEHVSPTHSDVAHSSFAIIINQLATRLARRHAVEVYSRAGGSFAAGSTHQDAGVTYRYVGVGVDQKVANGISRLERLINFPFRKHPFFSSPWMYRSYVEQAARLARDFGAESILFFIFPSMAPALRRYNPNARLILDMQNDWLAQLGHARVARYLRDVDLIAACSGFIRSRITARFPEMADRCVTLPNGMDAGRFTALPTSKPPPNPRILFIGRVSAEKGVHVLIRAFAQVAKVLPDAQLDIVGPITSPAYEYLVPISDDPLVQGLRSYFSPWQKRGDDYYLRRMRQEMPASLSGRIHFHGGKPNAELKPFFANAAVFCFPPVWEEPFGIPVIEAMASGVPVVTTASGGILEFAEDGSTALVVPRGNADALAKALLRALQDEALRRDLTAAAVRQTGKLYDWDTVAAELEKLCASPSSPRSSNTSPHPIAALHPPSPRSSTD